MRNITKFAIGAVALASIAAAEVEVSAYTGVHSKYIYRGVDLGNDTSFTDFGLDFAGSCDCGLDWYAGTWYASTQSDDEFDIFFGASKDLGFGTVSLGWTNYAYPGGTGDNGATKGSDSEINLGLATTFAGLDLSLVTSFGTQGALNNVTWIEGTIGYAFDLAGTELAFELAAGHQAGANATSDDTLAYTSATISTEYAISDDLAISPYVQYTDSAFELNKGGYEGLVAGASLSFSF